nr:response regulator [Planosporangium flavigriseum]
MIVEDDFRVAQIHVAFTQRVSGFRVVGTARTGQEARELVEREQLDLLLLDTYLPDESGLGLLRDLDTDAIMLTAASDSATVRAAFARGALNYLVKPFTAEQLTDRLTAYRHYRAHLARDRGLAQVDIDRAVHMLHDGDHPVTRKGQSAVTFRLVAEVLRAAGEPRSAADIAGQLGIARATAQRYLTALAQGGSARMSLRYGTSGRPEHLYTWSD